MLLKLLRLDPNGRLLIYECVYVAFFYHVLPHSQISNLLLEAAFFFDW